MAELASPSAAGRRPTRSTSPTTTRSGAGRCATSTGCSSASAWRRFQSGLAWITILRKRENFRAAFARLRSRGRRALRRRRRRAADGRRRHRAQPREDRGDDRQRPRDGRAARGGGDARRAAVVLRAGPTAPPPPRTLQDMPATTPESKALARELKRRGFRFVGPTTAYALMQATGIVNVIVRDGEADVQRSDGRRRDRPQSRQDRGDDRQRARDRSRCTTAGETPDRRMLWSFAPPLTGSPARPRALGDMPRRTTPESKALARELKRARLSLRRPDDRPTRSCRRPGSSTTTSRAASCATPSRPSAPPRARTPAPLISAAAGGGRRGSWR